MATSQLIKVETKGKWEGGVKTAVNIRNFSEVVIDEPPSLGGQDAGPNPVEFVLAGLTGCTSVMIALIAKEQKFIYEGADFTNEGSLDIRGLQGVAGVSPHFQTVRYTVEIQTDESEERVGQLQAEVEKRCPILNLLKDAGVKVESDWKRA